MEDFLNWKLTNRIHNLGYDGDTLMYIDDEEDIINDNSAEFIVGKPAILISAAFRFFREKYSWTIEIKQVTNSNWSYTLNNFPKERTYYGKLYDTYEEAELACLEKLLEIVEQKEK